MSHYRSALPESYQHWGTKDVSGPSLLSPQTIWVSLSHEEGPYLLLGLGGQEDDQDKAWIALRSDGLPGFPIWEGPYSEGFALRYPLSEQRRQTIQQLLPNWVGTSLRGCYKIKHAIYTSIADKATDALKIACIYHVPVNSVVWTPDIEITHAEQKWQLWSSGKITVGDLFSTAQMATMPQTLTQAAVELFSSLLRSEDRQPWPAEKRKRLAEAQTILERIPVRTSEGSEGMWSTWSWKTTVTRLRVTFVDGAEQDFFLCERHEGGLVDGEGDTDETIQLYEQEHLALQWFQTHKTAASVWNTCGSGL